jgi:serine/threonine-protein kinase
LANHCPKCGRNAGRRGCACQESLAPGTILAGRYLIVRSVGRGAAATVYQALDRMLDEPVAVKVLDAPRHGSAAAERLRSEIKLARRVTHPNVCRIHDYGEDGDRRFICMELIEGRNLREVLATRGRLTPGEACAVGVQAADALDAIHARGIVHRDVKTANLIRDAAGHVYLTDFGVATGGGPGSAGLAAGYVAGTPEYMSPEQAQGLRLDARSDLYALGVVLFELLVGEVPFRGATTTETLVRHVQQAPPVPALEDLGVPDALRAVIERLLAKQREDRPGSAAAVAAALRALAPPATIATIEPRAPFAATTVVSQTLTLPPRRRRQVLAAAGLAATVAVAAVGLRIATQVGDRFPHRSPVASSATPGPSTTLASGPAAPPAAGPSRRARAVPAPGPRASRTSVETEALPARTMGTLRAPVEVAATPAVSERPGSEPFTLSVAEAAPLTPEVGHLRFGITPWAEVTVDGAPVGQTPLPPLALPPGTYTARLEHPDFRPFLRKVTIQPGRTTPLDVDLRLDGIRNR